MSEEKEKKDELKKEREPATITIIIVQPPAPVYPAPTYVPYPAYAYPPLYTGAPFWPQWWGTLC